MDTHITPKKRDERITRSLAEMPQKYIPHTAAYRAQCYFNSAWEKEAAKYRCEWFALYKSK